MPDCFQFLSKISKVIIGKGGREGGYWEFEGKGEKCDTGNGAGNTTGLTGTEGSLKRYYHKVKEASRKIKHQNRITPTLQNSHFIGKKHLT